MQQIRKGAVMNPLHRVRVAGMASGISTNVVNFRFDGKNYQGLEGDTLASALMANGVKLVGRSFKLHRPRGLMGSWLEESNALVQLESGGYDEPNARATMIPLYEGLEARSQNAWPSVKFDLLGSLDLLHRMFPASFYYKSMIWPSWSFYERFVRPIAGLGKAPEARDAQNYQKRNLHCEIAICGGGAAGISAALNAARGGKRVVLIDDREEFGGLLLGESQLVDGRPAFAWVRDAIRELSRMPNVTLLPRTTVSGYYENNFLAAAERVTNHIGPATSPAELPRERLWRIRANDVILATGAIERPIAFPNNDRPGVMLASALGYHLNRFGVIAGQRVLLFTNNDSVYKIAIDLKLVGVVSVGIVDIRPRVPEKWSRRLRELGISTHPAHGVKSVKGKSTLKGVYVAQHMGDGVLSDDQKFIPCDVLGMSGGWTPTIHLLSQSGGNLKYDAENVCLVPDKITQKLQVVGAANGIFSLPEVFSSGANAGQSAAGLSTDSSPPHIPEAEAESYTIEPFWYTKSGATDKQWLDFQYDVKVSDIELAVRENFVSVEHIKRYTTGGMSVDQGKSSNFNILATISEITGKPIPDVGTTRFRPPFQPVTLGTFAGPTVGELYSASLNLPAHAWHLSKNAQFGEYGWLRPDFYPIEGEDVHRATIREVNSVRSGVGLFDGSPLGKIEIVGVDAARLLDRMYVNNIASLKVGAARYALMTTDNAVLMDDGVIVRLAENHFLVHATSGAVGRVTQVFEEYLQCEWPNAQVFVNNVTTQFANVTVTGPKARLLMQKLDSDIDFDANNFPHMHFRSGMLEGIPVRILRASFTGEVTFEVTFPARYARAMWERLSEVGSELGVIPYGIEAIEVMRTEKGYIHIGTDTDGTTTAIDIGMAKVIERKPVDFIGRRSTRRQAEQAEGRLQFVGLEPVDPKVKLPVGGHVVSSSSLVMPISSEGYVTSSCYSPTLEKHVALGLVKNGFQRLGTAVFVYSNGQVVAAKVVSPTHLDPEGARLNV
jgi:sarcosine oxidase subunit alpha